MNACISFTSRFLLFAVSACDLPFGDTIKGSPKTPRTGLEVRLPVRAPAFCDESGVGFAAHLAENSTALWSRHSTLRSDETWLPEWSGNPGRVQRWRSSVASGVWCFVPARAEE